MSLLLACMGVLLAGAILCLATWRSPRRSDALGAIVTVAACGLGIVPAWQAMTGGGITTFRFPWAVPYGSFSLCLDPLSGFFLLIVFVTCGLGAIYGYGYMKGHGDEKPRGPAWFLFNLLVASMVLLLLAHNGILFLVAWEVMSLASFFLVTFEDEREEVRRAGWTYLVATHLGTAFLLALFALLGANAQTMDFDRLGLPAGAGTVRAGAMFLLALIGFGTKAGLMPLHVWLPEAHPAAPSHVSAVMSGVMIKTGLYGLLRVLTFLGPPAAWWGLVLIGVGLVSGILGVLYALAQHDLKRLLAYSSVENIGIIALGLGIGLIGVSWHSGPIAVLGLAGALLHTVNHATFKSLLFFGAGSVLHSTGVRRIDQLGGLIKRMPWTGAAFIVGAAAISGLPPLNGFVGEFLIYLGAFRGIQVEVNSVVPILVTAGAGLALIGGLAAACFAKAAGAVFLGEPRSVAAEQAHECAWPMRVAMLVQAALCVLIAACAPQALSAVAPVVELVAGTPPGQAGTLLATAGAPLTKIVLAGFLLMLLTLGLLLLRGRLLAGRRVTRAVTWDCGYAEPTVRMQYTGSSFAHPLVDVFRLLLRTRKSELLPEGYFPARASLSTDTPDGFVAAIYRPVFGALKWLALQMRWIQHGRLQLYVLYIAATLLVLLFWKLG